VCIVSWCDAASAWRGGLTAGGGRFAGVDVADNDHVNVHLLFTVAAVSIALSMLPGGGVDLPHVGGVVWFLGR
jgi:hypothetical protein